MVEFNDQIVKILDDITTISGLKRSIRAFIKNLNVEYMLPHFYDNLGLVMMVYDFDLDYAKAFSINYLRKLLLLLDQTSSIITLDSLIEQTKIDVRRLDVLGLSEGIYTDINVFPEPDIFFGNPLINLEFDKIVIPKAAISIIYVEGASIRFEINGKVVRLEDPAWDEMDNLVRGQDTNVAL